MITSRQLEDAVGIDKAFKMMRLWERAVQGASGNQFTTRKLPNVDTRFKNLCSEYGFTEWQANMYMELDPNRTLNMDLNELWELAVADNIGADDLTIRQKFMELAQYSGHSIRELFNYILNK